MEFFQVLATVFSIRWVLSLFFGENQMVDDTVILNWTI